MSCCRVLPSANRITRLVLSSRSPHVIRLSGLHTTTGRHDRYPRTFICSGRTVHFGNRIQLLPQIDRTLQYVSVQQISRRSYTDKGGVPTEDRYKKGSSDPQLLVAAESRWQRLKLLVAQFMQGVKFLWGDLRLSMQLGKRISKAGAKSLTRDEHWHIVQTRKDWYKVAPFVIMFWIPTIGYFIPLLVFRYPKQFLSRQFLSEDQRAAYAQEDHVQRERSYGPLLQHYTVASANVDLLEKMNAGNALTSEEFACVKQSVSDDLLISKKASGHLHDLCACWDITYRVLGIDIPSSWLMGRVDRAIFEVMKDDRWIKRDGVKAMSDESIKQATHLRRLDVSQVSAEQRRAWLEEWVQMSAMLTDKDVSAFAHFCVFKAMHCTKL